MSQETLALLVGTTKGAFVIDGEPNRQLWSVRGPFCDGWPINHVVGDPGTGTIWAGGGGEWHGAGVWRSDDHGASWTVSKLSTGQIDSWAANDADFAASIGWTGELPPFGDRIAQVWSLARVGERLYAGTKPGILIVSDDEGRTWAEVKGLSDHPSASEWYGGAAGLVLHTIISDPANPEAMWIGISAAGVFASSDGGVSWERRNDLADVSVSGTADHPAAPSEGHTGLCVHHLVRAPGSEPVLYQQNHHGVWRSDDAGLTWSAINEGLPSTFGFPIRVHPRDPETIWTLPLNGDSAVRFPPGAAATAGRPRGGGATPQELLPGVWHEAIFDTVSRQGMAGDRRDPAGIYFGTNSGSVFASSDEGDTWHEVARHLPTILSLEVLESP